MNKNLFLWFRFLFGLLMGFRLWVCFSVCVELFVEFDEFFGCGFE